MSLDIEKIYQLTLQKEWAELLDFVHNNSKITVSDERVGHAVKIFEDELFSHLAAGSEMLDAVTLLEKLFLLHRFEIYKLTDERFNEIVVELVRLNLRAGNLRSANDYARYFPTHDLCILAVQKHQESLPKVVEHLHGDKIQVTENKNIATTDHTISLFKSDQELEFFMAVREVFPMFTVYPNVAISCLVQFDQIKHELSQGERGYFFSAIIDCVIFDHHRNYKPKYFFELDSSFHDSSEQKNKDASKDKILALAGQKLYRIRKLTTKQGKAEFIKLIREVFDQAVT